MWSILSFIDASSNSAPAGLRTEWPLSQSIGHDHVTYVSRRFRCVSMRPRAGMTLLTGPISAHFFLSRAARGRCDKQGAEGNPHRAQASRRQPEVCHRSADPRYVCWRSKHGLAARHTLCTPAKLTVEELTRYLIHAVHAGVAYGHGSFNVAICQWLQTIGGVRCNGSCCNGNGRSRPTVSVHAHCGHCYVTVLPPSCAT